MPSFVLDQNQINELVDRAVAAREKAYAPYSKFKVGAAVLTSHETVFEGCNVENASYGLCLCAERTAICSSVAAGEQKIVAVAVAAVPLAMPCGACRQFIHEFGKDITVICVDAEDPTRRSVRSIESLIPDCFSFET
jgi:cytidine deaminase